MDRHRGPFEQRRPPFLSGTKKGGAEALTGHGTLEDAAARKARKARKAPIPCA